MILAPIHIAVDDSSEHEDLPSSARARAHETLRASFLLV